MNDVASWLPRNGIMAQQVRGFDWSSTPLGQIESWPPELRTAVAYVLENHFPTALIWRQGLVTIYNDAFRPILGNKPEALGRSFADVWSEAWSEISPIAERAFAGESTFIEDYPLQIDRTGQAELAYFTFSYSPFRAADGTVLGFIDTVMETTDEVRSREALRESQERLNRVLDTDAVGVLFFNGEGVVVGANGAFLRMTGYTREQVDRRELSWRTMTPPEWVADSEEQMEKLVQTGRIGPYQKEYFHADGSRSWMLFAGRDLGDGTIAEYAFDLTPQKRAEDALRASEERSRLLLAELQHRVRNTIAVVRSIARRTAERSDNLEQMISHFEGRLNAFSRIQAAVTRNAGIGVDLKSIVEDELMAVATREGSQLRIKGPDIELNARTGEALSLAIHELATNAIKYGALAAEHGHVRVCWELIPDHGTDQLHFEWIETGVQPPSKPVREGFGHEMLLRSLPYDLGAETNIEFTDSGLRFTMKMPLGPEILVE